MIQVKQYSPIPEQMIDMRLDVQGINELKEILKRALATTPPDKYPDWVALADKLETLK